MPLFVTVKDLVDGGAIGELRTVAVRTQSPPGRWQPNHLPWRVLPEISGGGLGRLTAAQVDQVHRMPTLRRTVGPKRRVSAR